MQQQHLRTLAGVALSALVISTTAPRLVRAQQSPKSSAVPMPHGTFNPNATIVLPPASQPTSMPYPAYGTPVPGVNSGEVNPGVPQVVTLDQSIAIGYARSPLLAQARAQLEIESAPVQLARTALLPNIAGTASTAKEHSQDGARSTTGTGVTGTGATTASGGPLSFTSNALSVSLQQLIYDGGRVSAEIRAARNNQSSQAATYRRELQTVAFNVANAYYNSLAAQRATAVAVQTVLVDQTNEDLVSAQIRAGTAAKADLATAQLPTAQARVAVVQDQGAELSAQATFANAMGLDANTAVLPRDDTPVNGAAVTSTIAIPTYTQAFARAIALRPDVTAQALTVSGLQATLRATQLTNFPTLSGTATASTASTDLTGGTFRNDSSIGLALSIPIYDQGVVAAEVAQARGNLALGVANQQSVIEGVQLNVKQSLVALVSAKAALTSADVALNEAQVVLKSTQAQYRAGVTTLPLLLNAQVGLTQALSTQTTSVYTLRQAEQAFLYAEGANGAP
ncbi:MAG: TolC family protein [Candidatus Velthaea sp.]